jgi:3-oxoacyl-[acyl-carrier protein] reductase
MVNKTAVVTGASQGIGRSTAVRFAKDFSSLALVACRKENLEKVAGEVKKTGAQAIITDIDLSDPWSGKTAEKPGTIGSLSSRLARTGGQP